MVFSPAVKKEAAYYERLFGYLENGGAAFVKHFLMQRQIVLNGHGVAPATSGKETMRRMSMGDAESFLLDLYEAREAPFDFDLVRVDDLVQAVPAKLADHAVLARARQPAGRGRQDVAGGGLGVLGAEAEEAESRRRRRRQAWRLCRRTAIEH